MSKQKSKTNISGFLGLNPCNCEFFHDEPTIDVDLADGELSNDKLVKKVKQSFGKFQRVSARVLQKALLADYGVTLDEKPIKRIRRGEKVKPSVNKSLDWDVDYDPMLDELSELASEKTLTVEYTKLLNPSDSYPQTFRIKWDSFCEKFYELIPFGNLSLKKHLEYSESSNLAKQKKSASNRLTWSIIPGTFKENNTQFLRARNLLILEINSGFTFNSLSNKMKSLKLKCVLHTSFLHSKSKKMFTVYIPFNKALTKDIDGTCSRMLGWLNAKLGGHINSKCWNVCQSYYRPACPSDAVDLYKVTHMEGKPLIIANFMVDEVNPQMIQARSKPLFNEVVSDFNKQAAQSVFSGQ